MGQPDSREALALLQQFHENIANGVAVPIWAAQANNQHGSPLFAYRGRIADYLTELFYLVLGNAPGALLGAKLLLAGVLASGLFQLLRMLGAKGLSPALLLSVLSLATAPLVLTAVRQPDGAQVLAPLAFLPWVAAAFLALCRSPGMQWISIAASFTALLACSEPRLFIPAILSGSACLAVSWPGAKAVARSFAALVLGVAASAFHWLPYLKEMPWIAWRPAEAQFFTLGPAILAGGALPLLGFGWVSLRAAEERAPWRRGGTLFWRQSLLLCLLGVSTLYFSHWSSQWLHEKLACLPSAAVFLSLFVFFGVLLGARILCHTPLSRAKLALFALTCAMPALLWTLYIDPYATPTLTTAAPAAARVLPHAPQPHPRFVSGRGEGACRRSSPVRLDCELMVIRPSRIRFALFDYPGWTAVVDGAPAKADQSQPDPDLATLTLSLPPGKQVVSWQLRDSSERTQAKWLSTLAWLVVFAGLLRTRSGRKAPTSK